MNSYFSLPLLPREVRRRFFQNTFSKLKLADTALQFPDPLAVGHIGRQLPPGEFPPVRLYPEPSVVSLILSSRATSVIVRGGEELTTF